MVFFNFLWAKNILIFLAHIFWPTKRWKNYPQKLLRKTQIHFFPYCPELPKRPKQKNSFSKLWLIDQLYIELGLAEMCVKDLWNKLNLHSAVQWCRSAEGGTTSTWSLHLVSIAVRNVGKSENLEGGEYKINVMGIIYPPPSLIETICQNLVGRSYPHIPTALTVRVATTMMKAWTFKVLLKQQRSIQNPHTVK